MKLGLLLLAVVALVPSLSEGRTVSKCELREEMGKKIRLDKRLQQYKDQILAIVICEVERGSHLNTNFSRVLGDRKPETTAQPAAPTTAEGIQTSPPTAQPISTNVSSNSSASGSRKKRAAPHKPSRKSEPEESLTDILNDEENKFDEEEMLRDDDHLEDDEDFTEEESLEVGTNRRYRRSSRVKSSNSRSKSKKSKPKRNKVVLWSLGYYGLFQLSDSHFCDSGYRWSRNVCRTSCSAFTDDNIQDDVACFVNTGYWTYLLRTPSQQCHHSMKTYFAECN